MRRRGGIIPLILLALLAGLIFLFSPGMEKGDLSEPEKDQISFNSLNEERHYGFYQVDSIRALVKRVDPGGSLCRLVIEPGFVKFLKGKGEDERKFERIFLNKRSWENMAALENLPIEMLKGAGEFGFRARIESIEDQNFVLLPHGVVMGMLVAGNRGR